MFIYEKIVNHICESSVDTDSLSIIKKYSIFYTERDNDLIFKKIQNYVLEKNDLNFLYFLLFNLKSIQVFKICQDNLTIHYKKNNYMNFSLLEDETFAIMKSHFFNENTSEYDINVFINKYFWKHILTDRYEFIEKPNKWNYLENSRIFIKNFLFIEMNMIPKEIETFLDFIIVNFDFTNLDLKKINKHFKSNLFTLDLSFGFTENENDIEDLMSLRY